MTFKSLFTATAIAAALSLPTFAAATDHYPEKPIEFIVPWGPGGGSDLLMRLVSKHLETELGRLSPLLICLALVAR